MCPNSLPPSVDTSMQYMLACNPCACIHQAGKIASYGVQSGARRNGAVSRGVAGGWGARRVDRKEGREEGRKGERLT